MSVGEADYVKLAFGRLGNAAFADGIEARGAGQGGPGCAFFGLPGNPVSVVVAFYQFVQPALRRTAGESGAGLPPTFHVASASRFGKRPGRTEFQRSVVELGADGLVVHSTGSQGSGILRSMSVTNCFVILPHDAGNIEPGMVVEVQPLPGANLNSVPGLPQLSH